MNWNWVKKIGRFILRTELLGLDNILKELHTRRQRENNAHGEERHAMNAILLVSYVKFTNKRQPTKSPTIDQYSRAKELWMVDNYLLRMPFPFIVISEDDVQLSPEAYTLEQYPYMWLRIFLETGFVR